MQKNRILILTPYYLPGFKAGGHVQSISGLAEVLGSEFQFKIVCGDRDLGDHKPFDSEPSGVWYDYRNTKVLRLAPGLKGVRKLFAILRHEDYDILYLNSVWARKFSCLPVLWRALGLLPRKPVVIAPRGELSEGALSLKPLRKSLYLKLANAARIFEGVLWQASSEREEADIVRMLTQADVYEAPSVHIMKGREERRRANQPIVIAPDVRTISSHSDSTDARERKRPGNLRVATLGRVCRMKNIEYAISLFQQIRGNVTYDIYGPLEDKVYVAKCQCARTKLPENVTVRLMGPIPHAGVPETLGRYHVFLLPTLGENYGHVIIEAMSAGCVLLISDRTPWRDLENAGVGWDIPLSAPERFVKSLETALAWSDEEFAPFSKTASEYPGANDLFQQAVRDNRMLFRIAANVVV